MDQETRIAFKEVTETLTAIKIESVGHTKYYKGLELPERMRKAEINIQKKASWNALYAAVIVLIAGITVALAVASGFSPKP